MTKFFTLTSLYPSSGYRRNYWTDAAAAVLFFDSEGVVTLEEALLAARVIFKVPGSQTSVQCAKVVRSEVGQSVVGGWLVSPELAPRMPERKDWTGSARLPGETIYVADLHADPPTPQAIDLTNAYHGCTELFRVMGDCPCPKVGLECETSNIAPQIDVPLERLQTWFRARPREWYESLPYKIGDFEYISGRYLDRTGYGPGRVIGDNCLWVNELTLNHKHIEEAREKLRKAREDSDASKRFRKEHCTACVFNGDCRTWVRSRCGGKKTEDDVLEHVKQFLHYRVATLNNLEGFTREQRDYLIRTAGGMDRRARVGTFSSKLTWCYFAGFHPDGYYIIRHARQDRRSAAHAYSWDALCAYVPDLRDVRLEQTEPVSDELLLAYAALGVDRQITVRWGCRQDLLLQRVVGNHTVDVLYGNSRGPSSYNMRSLSVDSAPSDYWNAICGGRGYGWQI
jgi:hypothetical protein